MGSQPPPYFWKPWMSPYVAAGAFFFRKMAPIFSRVMDLFFGPLGKIFWSHGPKKEAHDSKKWHGMAWHGMGPPMDPHKIVLTGGLPAPQTPWRGACGRPCPPAYREAPLLGLSVDLGTKILVPGSWYQDLGTRILVPRSWYQHLGTKILGGSR